jgi:archaemetzincin
MPDLEIISVEFNHNNLLETIVYFLEEHSGFRVYERQEIRSLEEFYDVRRQQYDALNILKHFQPAVPGRRLVIYTSVDLYIPIFTFVFGLAGLGGNTAIVSSCRLMNEFYGLPEDDNKLIERIVKETVHEYGHLVHLRHCPDYRCVMASSNTVDDLDIRGHRYCPACLSEIHTRQN